MRTAIVTSWSGVLSSLLAGADLDPEAARWSMGQIMDGEATQAQVAGFAVALRAKGEAPAEVAALVGAMLARARTLDLAGPVVDTCGTGGDRAHTVNISTMAALVVAGAGHRVAKHGNRAASSSCGSADVLEELGVVIDLPPAEVARCADEAGITFCFAPVFHPALRHASAPRREIGVATVFNFLGPLCNPARPTAQAVGVFDPRMAAVMAAVLGLRGVSALVVRGDDGLDELSTVTTSRVWSVRDGEVRESVLDPQRLGLPGARPEDLRGGDAANNAAVVRRLVDGEPGPVRDAVLLNAAAALAAAGPGGASVEELLAEGLVRGAEALDSGDAAGVLERWVSVSQQLRRSD
ncbi:MAG TPA: anthranilate phosphoribosyltransferase [Mycobacteriales bacterium]|nr:anthranilate phosphoribosyltransferase [Mycobacteriales bacterium]